MTSSVSWNWKVKLTGISWEVFLIDEFRKIRSVVAVGNNQVKSQNLPVNDAWEILRIFLPCQVV